MIGTSDGNQFQDTFDMAVKGIARQQTSVDAGISDIPLATNHNLRNVLQEPKVQQIISNPQIDRSHEVPYIAGASKDPNDFTTHVDKSVPTSVTVSGKTFDPAIPLNIHEQVEREVMERLIAAGHNKDKAYEIAHHEYAEPAEDMWYRQHGINVQDMNKFWNSVDSKTEKDKGDFPPDLYTKPYPHDQVEGIQHEPTGISAPDKEWRTYTKVATTDDENFIRGHPLGSNHPDLREFLQPMHTPMSSPLAGGASKPVEENVVKPKTSGSVKLIPSKTFNSPGQYDIVNESGEKVGHGSMWYNPISQDVHIGYVASTLPSTKEIGSVAETANPRSWSLGSTSIKQLVKAVADLFPEAATISGYRISGSRSARGPASTGNFTQTIKIPGRIPSVKTPEFSEEEADLMRRIRTIEEEINRSQQRNLETNSIGRIRNIKEEVNRQQQHR